MMYGRGIKYWPNGDKFLGEFKNNKEHGEGTFTNSDGDLIEGTFLKT